jgi:hypothetical protein
MKMKWTSYLLSGAASAALMLAFVSSAHAQWQDADFNKFLSNHPGVASQLQANPNLINDPAFRHAHPDLQEYLQNHQRVSEAVRSQAAGMGGPGMGGHGYYPGANHGYANYGGNPAYNPANGAWDQNHQWQNREWWMKNHPNWVKANHPEWWANHH